MCFELLHAVGQAEFRPSQSLDTSGALIIVEGLLQDVQPERKRRVFHTNHDLKILNAHQGLERDILGFDALTAPCTRHRPPGSFAP
jgi:hypothetical protein